MNEYPPELIIFISIICLALLPIAYIRDISIKQDREREENARRAVNWHKKRGVFDRNTAVKKAKLGPVLNC